MENITSCSLSIEKRYDHLKSFSNNIGGLVLELKDLIKVHEILIYKEKLKTSEKDKIKKQQDDLLVLKQGNIHNVYNMYICVCIYKCFFYITIHMRSLIYMSINPFQNIS